MRGFSSSPRAPYSTSIVRSKLVVFFPLCIWQRILSRYPLRGTSGAGDRSSRSFALLSSDANAAAILFRRYIVPPPLQALLCFGPPIRLPGQFCLPLPYWWRSRGFTSVRIIPEMSYAEAWQVRVWQELIELCWI